MEKLVRVLEAGPFLRRVASVKDVFLLTGFLLHVSVVGVRAIFFVGRLLVSAARGTRPVTLVLVQRSRSRVVVISLSSLLA